MDKNEYIDFDDLQKNLKIKSKELFYSYIKSIFKDLSEKSDDSKFKSISKINFFEYMKLSVFISESIFKCFDEDNDGVLNLQEFGNGMSHLYIGSFEDTLKLIFKIYDNNRDGYIHKEDVRLLLSYLPLREDHSKTEYKYQMESQLEINDIVTHTFGNKEKLSFDEYVKSTECKQSDSYLQLLCYLYEKKPFNENSLILLDSFNNKKSNSKSPKKANEFYSPETKKRILSPKKQTNLSPVNNYLKKIGVKKEFNITLQSDHKETKIVDDSIYDDVVRMNNVKKVETTDDDNFESKLEKGKSCFDSPSNFLRKLLPKKKEFNILGSLVKISDDDNSDKQHNFKLLKNTKDDTTELKPMEGWVYKMTQNNSLKKYWLVVTGMDIYYYKDENKSDLSGMHNLSGCYIKEHQSISVNNDKYFSFAVIFQNKTRIYYTTDREQSISWVNRLRKAVGYESFFEYYDIIDDIGEGKFGVVKLGVHKKTKLRVAIKTIKKENVKTKQDQELIKTEIDIMKMCRHPNIVTLLDHFENSEYIFIVMEYIPGGDLTKYVRSYIGGKNNKTLPEKRTMELMRQLASGLQYLHSFGIVHRDLKPDNLMVTEKSINGELRIMDFGLSKMMHHEEKVTDGFGTLSFVAPEVLIRKNYDSKVDVWSFGVTIYYLLSGDLPFDDSSDNEEVIAKKVVYSELQFKNKIFEKISKEAKALIADCLIKEPIKRISIKDALAHPWFSKKFE